MGASIFISGKLREDELFFAESQSVIIISIDESRLLEMERIASKNIVPCVTIGRVKDNGKLKMNDSINLPLDEIQQTYRNTLPKLMEMTV